MNPLEYYNGIAMSDGINRKNHMFTFPVLHESYSKSWRTGVPTNLNHDSTRPFGWTNFAGIYIEPGKTYLTNITMYPETEDDRKVLNTMRAIQTHQTYVENHKEEIGKLEQMLGDNLTDEKSVAPISAVAFNDPGIVFRVFPELAELINDDGLIDLQYLEPVQPGIYKRDKYLLFAHRYLRRSCSIVNSLNDDFLQRFQELPKQYSNLSLRIHLDLDLIGLAGTESGELEYAYWWGLHFKDDLENIPSGVTRHQNDTYDNLFSNLVFTDFGWYFQDGNKTLEIEEVCDRPTIIKPDEVPQIGCRYVHSFLNMKTNLPTHLDGAIRAYSEEKLLARLDVNLDATERDTVYTKLWRIDGDIPVILWKELITHYYRDNHLVGEYFGGVDEKLDLFKLEDKQRAENKPLPASEFVPVDLVAGDGLRIYYHFAPAFKTSYDVEAHSREFISSPEYESERLKVIETETITILKLLNRYGVKARIPNTVRVLHEDMVFNFPIFRCKDVAAASAVQKAMLECCVVWQKCENNRLISYSIAVNTEEDTSLQISFAGHVDDFAKVYHTLGTDFPDCPGFLDWIQQLYQVNNSFGKANLNPRFFDLVTSSKELRFKRMFVPEEYIKKYFMEENSLKIEMNLPTEKLHTLASQRIGVALTGILKSSQCSRCKKEYRDCSCVKFIDDVGEKVVDFQKIGCIWTNRHA